MKKGGISIQEMSFEDISYKVLELCIELLRVEPLDHKELNNEASSSRRVDEISLRIYDVYIEKYPEFLDFIKKSFFEFLESV